MFLLTIVSAVIATGMALFSKWKVAAWKKRDFGTRDFKWNLLIGISAVLSFAFAHLGYFLSSNLWVSSAIGMLAFLVVLSSVTDLALMKIPSELTTLAQYTPIPFIIALWPSFDYYDHLSMIMWAVIVFVFFVLSLMRLFGFADVKLLFAFGTLLSWWAGPEYMMYALLGASALALLAMPVTSRFGYGLKKTLKDTTTWNAEEKKLEAVSRIAPEELDGLNRKQSRKKRGKKKTFLPFGPALLVSYLVMALIAASTVYVETYTWWG